MSELLYQIALSKIPKVGPKLTKQLVSYCGGPQYVFEASKKELMAIPAIGAITAQNIINKIGFQEAEAELRFIEKNEIQTFFYTEKDYPHRLKNYDDAPALLYYKGTSNLNAPRIVGIVGTRKPSAQGLAICEELVEGLATYQPLIISGLAYGIDITAHKKSLNIDIETIGVLGHGLGQIYPNAHKRTAYQMVEKGGLLTEFTSQTKPDRERFPMRNRIIAGLCDSLIVVETANKGGSMITANLAFGYNKDVFAVPGRIRDENSKGCNMLIKSHRAALIESAKDIGYVMRWEEIDSSKTVQRQLFTELAPEEQNLVTLLKEHDGLGIDRLSFELQQHQSQLAALLLGLEFKGVLKQVPGKRYVLI